MVHVSAEKQRAQTSQSHDYFSSNHKAVGRRMQREQAERAQDGEGRRKRADLCTGGHAARSTAPCVDWRVNIGIFDSVP